MISRLTSDASTRPIRRRRMLRYGAWLLAFAGFLVCAGCAVSFFFMRYDFPLRIAGRYEKNLFLAGRPFSISPNGTSIVYSTPLTGHGDIYEIGADGTNQRRLTSDPEYEGNPAYSPDGRR